MLFDFYFHEKTKVTGSSLGQVRAIATSEISPRRRDAYRLPTPISMLSKVIIFQFSSVFEASEANILPYGIKTYVQACHMEQKKLLCGVRGSAELKIKA